MSSVALGMIVKNEREAVGQIVFEAIDYFDQIVLTVSDKATANFLKKVAKATPKVEVYYREWTDRFDEARNANLEKINTEFFYWQDADDTFDFTQIPGLVEYADRNGIDEIFLPYNYAQDDEGNTITRHWRERLLRRSKGFESRGWVHETFITDEKHTQERVDLEVRHNTTRERAHESVGRNHAILEKAYAATNDPRYLHYLGMSAFTAGDYEKAASLLSDYLGVGGSVEDSYRALSVISESAYHLGRHDMALEFASKAATLKPEYPMSFWLLAQYEADQENWAEALEWVKVSLTKPDPNTLSVYDPSARERAILIAAQADFMLGNFNKALGWLRKIPKNRTAQSLVDDFQKEADAETFVSLLPKLRKFFTSDKQLFSVLVPDIKYDTRILPFRQMVTTPKKWDEKSIVIFCGQGFEEWGPHTLDKGMGGSEEAIVYLAPELAKLGYNVTVYGEADYIQEVDPNDHDDKTVRWLPWKQIDTRDQFNIFISWRAPQYLERINAKVKLCDVHDVLPKEIVKNYPDVTYMVKSQYHRDLYPELPDDKFVIIGNGISKKQFEESK